MLFSLVCCCWCAFQVVTYSGSQIVFLALLLLFSPLTCPIHLSSSFSTPAGWQTVVVSWNCGRRGDKVGQRLSSLAQSAGFNSSSQHYVMPPACHCCSPSRFSSRVASSSNFKQTTLKPPRQTALSGKSKETWDQLRSGVHAAANLEGEHSGVLGLLSLSTFDPPSTLDGSFAFHPSNVLCLLLT